MCAGPAGERDCGAGRFALRKVACGWEVKASPLFTDLRQSSLIFVVNGLSESKAGLGRSRVSSPGGVAAFPLQSGKGVLGWFSEV